MKKKSQQVVKLNLDEVRRLLTRLAKRYRDHGVVNVGFGTAKKNDRFQSARGEAVVFFVKRKKKLERLNSSKVLPAQISTFVIRDSKRIKLVVKTDVMEQRNAIRKSGYRTHQSGYSENVTSGVVVKWKTEFDIQQWGIVTVSHFLRPVSSNLGPAVIIVRPDSTTSILGEVLFKMDISSKIDAALVRVNSADLAPFGLTTSDGTVIRRFSQIASDGGKSGYTNTFDDGRILFSFEAGHYLAQLAADGLIWKDVVIASSASGIFRGGRSGAVWTRQGTIVGLQVARESPLDKRGFGQIFDSTWSEICAKAIDLAIAKPDSLKLVCVF